VEVEVRHVVDARQLVALRVPVELHELVRRWILQRHREVVHVRVHVLVAALGRVVVRVGRGEPVERALVERDAHLERRAAVLLVDHDVRPHARVAQLLRRAVLEVHAGRPAAGAAGGRKADAVSGIAIAGEEAEAGERDRGEGEHRAEGAV
jgi:hypothetical protein